MNANQGLIFTINKHYNIKTVRNQSLSPELGFSAYRNEMDY